MIDNRFESFSYDIFDNPFDSIEGVATFILCEENDSPAYSTLRYVIRRQATATPQAADWSSTALRSIIALPEARLFMSMADSPFTQVAIARRILNRAVTILREAS